MIEELREEEQEIQVYLGAMESARLSVPQPWEDTKRVTKRGEACLTAYAGGWPAGQWPNPGELGLFLTRFLAHILTGHGGSCYWCEEWTKPEGAPIRFWPTISLCISPEPGPIVGGVRLVERKMWHVIVETSDCSSWPDGLSNRAKIMSYPRLYVYGRYGVERLPERED